MDPSYDDLADTITANLRTMKVTAIRLDQMNAAFNLLIVALCFVCITALFLKVRNVR